MKKTLFVALGALLTMLFGGCATYTAADIVISPPSLKGEKWTMSGTETTDTLTVRINGNPVIQGPLSYGGPTSLSAIYEGHAIQTVVHSSTNMHHPIARCMWTAHRQSRSSSE
ncbi:MAG TPA: hypothetical protein VJS89_01675 [Gammaproteobacteria bacterium]|nr:hypothetical protein [Gammaproteobacteria bacterium]